MRLTPCEACRRHIDATTDRCPFCGAARRAEASADADETVDANDDNLADVYGAPPPDDKAAARRTPAPMYGAPPPERFATVYGAPPPQARRRRRWWWPFG